MILIIKVIMHSNTYSPKNTEINTGANVKILLKR